MATFQRSRRNPAIGKIIPSWCPSSSRTPTRRTIYYNDDDNGSLRDEYDSPEDLYEENPDDYKDLDDAWDAWEND